MINALSTTQLLVPLREERHGDDVAIHFAPGPFAHRLFAAGAAPDGPPLVLEAILVATTTSRALPFGDPPRRAAFSLVLLGCRHAAVLDAVRRRLDQILSLRPEVVAVPHDAARLSDSGRQLAGGRAAAVDVEEF